MTKAHAYLARIKDQEKDVIAVPDGIGRALCVSSDKHWTLTREWDELHIIAPLVESEGSDHHPKPRMITRSMLGEVSAERDEWKARAEVAERDRDEWQTLALSYERELAVNHEAAEARTTPAVSRADIEKAIRGKVWAANREPNKAGFHRVHVDWATDAVWSLVSGDDPAVFVVRESDIAAVKVQPIDGGKWWLANGALVNTCESPTESEAQEAVDDALATLVGALAARRAIEAEAVVDLVEVKARELYRVATPDTRWETVADEYRRIAAHVLEQEDRDVDQ